MRGILSWGAYLSHHRLDRRSIAAVAGTGGGGGTRTVAGYDEDAITLGVAAAEPALREAPAPHSVWFSTTEPPYLDRTNAVTLHAALRLGREIRAFDAIGSVRSASGSLLAALESSVPSLVVAADVRGGLPGGGDESAGGDGAAALLVGPDTDGPVLAEFLGSASVTEEFLDRWRLPGERTSRLWEERFGEIKYSDLGREALKLALADVGIGIGEVGALAVAGLHGKAARAVALASGASADRVVDRLEETVGNTGAAQPAMLLVSALERAEAGQIIVLLTLADGADALVFRATGALESRTATSSLAEQSAAGAAVPYGTYLTWRGFLPVEPPRRPEPARPSASAANRNRAWKYGFTGSRGEDGVLRLPPSPLDGESVPMATTAGTIVTFTIDRLAYSPSPPIVFAVVDFDGGGRLPIELTDVDEKRVRIGDRVEATFRRLHTAEGVHNYFWKARPMPASDGKA